MIDKEISLALFIDKYNVNNHYYILKKFKNINELDDFTSKFNDYEELRKYFEVDISEYLMDNRKIVSENETKNKKFKGRISAFYYNSRKEMEFVEIKYQKRKVVRDYLLLNNQNDAISFMKKVIDIALEKLNKKPLLKRDKVYYYINILDKYNYHVSEEEKKYLYEYFTYPSDKNYNNIIVIMKTNVRRQFKLKEEKKTNEALEQSLEKVVIDDDADEFLKYNSNSDEDLFLYHDIDEIDKYSNRFRRK